MHEVLRSPESQQVRIMVVDSGHEGQRLDNFLLGQLKGAPRTLIYRIVRRGEVRVNRGRVRADYRLQVGDQVRIPPLRLANDGPSSAGAPGQAMSGHLESCVLYEQHGLLVLNKPYGLAVHGGSGVQLGVIEALRAMRPDYTFLELVHRLDRDTSGLLLLAYERKVLLSLQAQLREDHMVKRYEAVLVGDLQGRRHRVELPLLKYLLPSGERRVKVDREGKASRSDFEVKERRQGLSRVNVRIYTGRTHQIRVHARSLGHAVLGDDKYGDESMNLAWRQRGHGRLFLHARELEFSQGGPFPQNFEAPLDPSFEVLWQSLSHGETR
ncbi:MAG: RluA family pseudouridine synthase [Pseudomonadales bacterium]|nr:RluA family pseudouridine synthase [Pseudomonadales bacterium]